MSRGVSITRLRDGDTSGPHSRDPRSPGARRTGPRFFFAGNELPDSSGTALDSTPPHTPRPSGTSARPGPLPKRISRASAHLPRTRRPRRPASLAGSLQRVALLCVLSLTAGCGLVGDDGTGEDEVSASEDPSASEVASVELPVASTTTSTTAGSDLEIQVRALEKVGNGKLRLTLGVANHGDEDMRLFGRLGGENDNKRAQAADAYTASGVTLLDIARDEQYLSLTTAADDTCLCSHLDDDVLKAGSMEQMWVVFPAPEGDVEALTVLTPVTEPFFDVPVTTGERYEAPETAEPRVLSLEYHEEDLAEPSQDPEAEEEGHSDWPPLPGGSSTDSDQDRKVLGSSEGTSDETRGLVTEVNESWRDSSGRYTALAWSVRNEGTDVWRMPINALRAHGQGYAVPALAGVALTDTASSKRYLPPMNEAKQCLCPRDLYHGVDTRLEPGASRTFWSLYALPPQTRKVTVEPAGFAPITDIPVDG